MYPPILERVFSLLSWKPEIDNWKSEATNQMPPVGSIIDYYGDLDSTGKHPTKDGLVDAHWHICDGTDNTPNLKDKFIIGAGNAVALGGTGGSDSITPSVSIASATQSISINNHTLTTSQIPSHTHDQAVTANPGTGSYLRQDWNSDSGSCSVYYQCPTYSTGGGGAHSHAVTTSEHNHTITTNAFDNKPPYFGLYKIMRMS